MKKWLALLLAAVLAFSMVACQEAAPAADQAAATAGDGPDYSKVKMGIISNTTAQDGGWGTALWNSIVRVKEKLGLKDEQIVWCESIYDGTIDVDNMIDSLVQDGCKVIIGHSAGYVDQFAAAAKKYPEVYFSAYECPVDGCPNYAMYSISDEAASFICGYAAAKMSNGNELGYIGNMPTSDLICCLDSFTQGARYANPDAKIKIVWINSWYDPATEKSSAEALLQSGLNSIGYMGSTASVAQACEAAGAFTTGMYIDMFDYAPKAVLTSHVYDWDLILTEIADRVAKGEWPTDPIIYSFADGAAKVGKINEEVMPEELVKEINDLIEKLKSGEIQVFAGPVKDNHGNVVVEEGKTLTPEDLIYIDFLVEGIEGDIP